MMTVDFINKKELTSEEANKEAQKLGFYPAMFQAARVMRKLGILGELRINKKGITPEQIAENLNIHPYGVKVLMEAGLSIDITKLLGENTYRLGKVGYFLELDKQVQVNVDFIHDVCYKGLFSLEESIVNHKPEGLKELGEWDTVYEGLAQLTKLQKESWFGFDHFYSDNAFPNVLPVVFENKPKWILDVGGNTGKWSVACCNYDADVKLTIVDLPGQWEKAKENIEKIGLINRINGVAVNVLDDETEFPKNPDAIWMSQFLDCFSEKEIVKIVAKAKKAMSTTTTLYIMETFWDKQKHEEATYCLHGTSLYFTAIANGNSKMYHSKDMVKCVEKAGLVVNKELIQIGDYHTLLKCTLS